MRVEYPGALYHVTSRGNGGCDIFNDDQDRLRFLSFLVEVHRRLGWIIYGWVLMSNHFHFVIETPEPNLSEGMQWLVGNYASSFNRRHKRSGHLFGQRFSDRLIEKATYLHEVIRYVVLNPVRAGMVDRPEAYHWSSYRASAGYQAAPEWLGLAAIAPWFGEPESWQEAFRAYVDEKLTSTERLWDKCERQIYLGSEEWYKSVRKIVESRMWTDDHPYEQKKIGRPHMPKILEAVGMRALSDMDQAVEQVVRLAREAA